LLNFFQEIPILSLEPQKEFIVETSHLPAPRTPLHLDVSFRRSYARQDTQGTLKNISLTGAFLELDHHDLRLDEKINLTFTVGSRERKITAQIIWKNSLGAGIKFIPQNNRDVQIVDDLIYFVETKRMGHREILGGIFDGLLKKVS
jgi:PilZ domain